MPTKAQNKATNKYKKANYHRVPLELPKEEYAELQQIAKESKEGSVNGFIKAAIREKMEREKGSAPQEDTTHGAEMPAEDKKDHKPMKL